MGKQRKPKISKIKRNNQTKTKLSKQGKLKARRHKPSKKKPQKSVLPCPQIVEEEEESDDGEDLMNMVEKDDLDFLRKAISNKSYNLLKKIRLPEMDEEQGKKKEKKERKKMQNNQSIEELYVNKLSTVIEETEKEKSIHMLLPIKTQNGCIKRRFIEKG